MRRPLALLLSIAAITFTFEDAEAQSIIRPSSRPWWFAGGLGPAVGVTTSRGGGGTFTQFMLSQEIGGHFSGDGEGPALAGHISEAFGRGIFRLTLGPRFYYDIEIANKGIYVAPYAQIGYTLFADTVDPHYVNMQFGVSGRFVLEDRGLLFIQLGNFDFNFNDNGLILFWDLQMGGGVTF